MVMPGTLLREGLVGHEADQLQELLFRALDALAHRRHAVVAVDGVIEQRVSALLEARLPGFAITSEGCVGGGIGVAELAAVGVDLRQSRVFGGRVVGGVGRRFGVFAAARQRHG
ncbi:hypothetical protein EMIT0232MI5_30375 [Pseudomonas sp. IT-232MI5]